MMTKLDVKIGAGRTGMRCSFVIIMVVTCAALLVPQSQVAVAQDDIGERPVAVISGTLLVYVDHEVYLDGSGSYDPGGSSLDYQWKLVYAPEDSTAVISEDTDSEASFNCDKTGVYQVQLVVNNGFVNSKPVYATITCMKRPYFW